jgi:hypothetical protein
MTRTPKRPDRRGAIDAIEASHPMMEQDVGGL